MVREGEGILLYSGTADECPRPINKRLPVLLQATLTELICHQNNNSESVGVDKRGVTGINMIRHYVHV